MCKHTHTRIRVCTLHHQKYHQPKMKITQCSFKNPLKIEISIHWLCGIILNFAFSLQINWTIENKQEQQECNCFYSELWRIWILEKWRNNNYGIMVWITYHLYAICIQARQKENKFQEIYFLMHFFLGKTRTWLVALPWWPFKISAHTCCKSNFKRWHRMLSAQKHSFKCLAF